MIHHYGGDWYIHKEGKWGNQKPPKPNKTRAIFHFVCEGKKNYPFSSTHQIGSMIRKRYHIPFLFLFTVSRLLHLHPMPDEDNSTKLVYKDCAEQKLHDPSGTFSRNLKALLASLVELSGQKAFSTTTSGSGENVIMGMFQCRGDLSNPACCSCVSKISDMLERGELCSNLAAAARVQLSECYLRYEVVGFEQVPETLLLYKVCGPKQVNGIDGFEKRRDLVFGMVGNCSTQWTHHSLSTCWANVRVIWPTMTVWIVWRVLRIRQKLSAVTQHLQKFICTSATSATPFTPTMECVACHLLFQVQH